jgi:hypothetical protein
MMMAMAGVVMKMATGGSFNEQHGLLVKCYKITLHKLNLHNFVVSGVRIGRAFRYTGTTLALALGKLS